MRRLATEVVDRAFPRGSRFLTGAQRATVAGQIMSETRPAAMLDTIYAALDKATGSSMASDTLKAAAKKQAMVGGDTEGQLLRREDIVAINEMWERAARMLSSTTPVTTWISRR